jgi:hypothetical protein
MPVPRARCMDRREALALVAGGVTSLAGCSGFASSSSSRESGSSAGKQTVTDGPSSGATTDPELLLVRAATDRPPVWLADQGGEGDGRPTERPEERHIKSEVVDSQNRVDRLSVAPEVDDSRVASFLQATDFASETVFVETVGTEACFRLALCRISWTAHEVSTDYARQSRPWDERCAVDEWVFETRLVRIPDAIDAARTARTALVALQSLRDARDHARYAAAGWAVAERGLSAGDLRRERRRVVADARSVRQDHEYVGTDPVRAALVHARIEAWLARATDADQPRVRDEGELLTVAQWGESVESARAHLDDATHVAERYRASLPDDAEAVDATLSGAAEALVADARSRRSDLPPEPTAEEWGLAERVVADLRQEVEHGPESVADADGPASVIIDLTDRLARFRALERVRERVDAGEITRVERAEEVRTARTEAYDALDAALADSPDSDLARTVLSDLSWRVVSADRDIDRSRGRGEVSAASLDDVMEHYIVTAAVARATPAACRQTVDALETA